MTTDHYGRAVPKHAQGTEHLKRPTASARLLIRATTSLFDRIINPDLLIRRLNITVNHVVDRSMAKKGEKPVQLDLFTDYEALRQQQEAEEQVLEKEQRMQEVLLNIKQRYGKNAILRGLNFEEGATAIDRNKQIGGHKA